MISDRRSGPGIGHWLLELLEFRFCFLRNPLQSFFNSMDRTGLQPVLLSFVAAYSFFTPFLRLSLSTSAYFRLWMCTSLGLSVCLDANASAVIFIVTDRKVWNFGDFQTPVAFSQPWCERFVEGMEGKTL